jgi:hypothetical protein
MSDADLFTDLLRRVTDLEETLKSKDDLISTLEERIRILELNSTQNVSHRNNNGGNLLTYASMLQKDSTGKTNEAIAVITTAVRREAFALSKIEKNIIVSGLPTPQNPDDEKRQLGRVLNAVNIDISKVRKFHRLHPSNSNASASARTSRSTKPPSIVVEFNDVETKDQAVKAAKNLRKLTNFDGVYINPDKTRTQRLEEAKLREKRNSLNEALENVDSSTGRRYGLRQRDKKKFYWVVCPGGVREYFFD